MTNPVSLPSFYCKILVIPRKKISCRSINSWNILIVNVANLIHTPPVILVGEIIFDLRNFTLNLLFKCCMNMSSCTARTFDKQRARLASEVCRASLLCKTNQMHICYNLISHSFFHMFRDFKAHHQEDSSKNIGNTIYVHVYGVSKYIYFFMSYDNFYFKTLRTGSFKLFKRPFPGFLTILTL